MRVTTYEAIVEDGRVKLLESVRLPEHARIFVVVPDVGESANFRVGGPRLVHPEDAADFVKEIVEEPSDAGLR